MALILFMIIIAIFIFMSIVAVVLRVISAIFKIILPVRQIEPLPPLQNSQLNHAQSKRVVSQEVTTMRCRRSTCRGVNPGHARFCRQCGMAMSAMRVDHRVADLAQRTGNGVTV